jgi:hypothetical protein
MMEQIITSLRNSSRNDLRSPRFCESSEVEFWISKWSFEFRNQILNFEVEFWILKSSFEFRSQALNFVVEFWIEFRNRILKFEVELWISKSSFEFRISNEPSGLSYDSYILCCYNLYNVLFISFIRIFINGKSWPVWRHFQKSPDFQ